MIEAILLDCGAVLVAPVTGDWMLPPGHEAILGEDFAREHLAAFRSTRVKFVSLLPDANRVDTDDQEYGMLLRYYRSVFDAMGVRVDDEQIARLSRAQVYCDDRYALFADVLPTLARWRGQYRLAIISDAPPSTRRIMDSMGVTAALDCATYSCELGVLKPDARMYLHTLDKLGIAPERAVFVDDLPGNLEGAQAVGIRGIQMCRRMPERFTPAPQWNGPVANDLASLDSLLTS